MSARRYTLSDGLAGMQVEDLCQDGRGLLWIATADGGVSRFDGTDFGILTKSDGLPHLTVMSIAEDAEGRMWFGTLGGGLARFDGRGFRVYTTGDGLPSNEILSLQTQADGRLRVLTSAGIGWFGDDRCGETLTEIDGRPIGRVYDMATDATGTTWLATQDRGVISLDGRPLDPGGESSAVQWAWKFAQDPSGHLWIAFHRSSRAAMARYDPSRLRLDRIDAIPGGRESSGYGARHVRVDDRGRVWVARPRDVVVYDGQTWHSLSDGLPGIEFRQPHLTYEDREGNLWVGVWNGGLVLCEPLGLEYYTESSGSPEGSVTCLAEDGADRLWIGTEGGLSCLEEDRFRPIRMGQRVGALLVDRAGVLWMGSEARVCREPDNDPLQIPVALEDEWDFIRGMVLDRAGRILIFTRGGRLGWVEEDRMVELEQELPGLCNVVLPDGDGGYWIGVQNESPALYHMEVDHRLRAADSPELESISHVKALCESGRTLWVGTNNGLFALEKDSGQVRPFTKEQDGLPTNSILSLAMDNRDRLWIGLGGGGVLRYDGRMFRSFRFGPSVLQNTVNVILCDRRDRAWFGTHAGLTMYQVPSTPPGITIRQSVKGRLLEALETVSFPEGEPEIALHLQGIRFHAGGPEEMRYSHRLVGHAPAEAWSEFTPERRVIYQGLPAGEYCFEVRARDQDNLVSKTAALEVQVVRDGEGACLPGPESEPQASVPAETTPGPTLSRFLSQLEPVFQTDMTVLVAGETGTGKSLLARQIHARSPRGERPFVRLSCGALPSGLVEGELFGCEQEGSRGAVTAQVGCLERAHGGTLFLEKVGDLSSDAQRALLHALEEDLIKRVGGSEPIRVDVRVIAETDSDLETAVSEGTFRRDLYYRLTECPVVLPPLRDRPEEIPVLAAHFAAEFARHLNRPCTSLSDEIMTHLQSHSWPGNVRELEHMIRRAVVLCKGDVVEVSDLPLPAEATLSTPRVEAETQEKDDRQQILKALKTSNWIVYGDRGAARLLGMHPEKLRSRMAKYGLRRPKPPS